MTLRTWSSRYPRPTRATCAAKAPGAVPVTSLVLARSSSAYAVDPKSRTHIEVDATALPTSATAPSARSARVRAASRADAAYGWRRESWNGNAASRTTAATATVIPIVRVNTAAAIAAPSATAHPGRERPSAQVSVRSKTARTNVRNTGSDIIMRAWAVTNGERPCKYAIPRPHQREVRLSNGHAQKSSETLMSVANSGTAVALSRRCSGASAFAPTWRLATTSESANGERRSGNMKGYFEGRVGPGPFTRP